MNKIRREALRLLRKSNLNYRVVDGTKHSRIYIDDDMVMVMNLSNGAIAAKDTKNLEQIIRKKQKELNVIYQVSQ